MKRFLSIAAMLLITFCSNAQIDTVRTEQDHIFQYINKTLIPTGYLNEYGPEAVDKTWLTGILTDSNYVADIELFNFLYNDIENSRINTAIAPMYSSDSMQLYTNLARYDTVSILAFLKADYASLREDALQQNLFTASNNQIFDVAGRTQSPYIQKHVFAAATVLPVSPFKNEIRLGFQPLFYSNGSTPQVLSVQIDLLDGTGYHTLYASGTAQQVSKTYTDSSGYKKFAVKVTYTGGATDVCYTAQYVNVEPPPAGGMLMRYGTLTPAEISTPAHTITPTVYLNVNPIIPNIPFLPHYQQLLATQHFNQDMKMYIRYSTKRNGTALQGKIVKPFIVVEGYDITDASKLLKPVNYGINDFRLRWCSINNKKVAAPVWFSKPTGIDELEI